MKKLFIGLLIIAAGAGIYYFLQSKKTPVENSIQKGLVVGKWKLNTLDVRTKDSRDYLMSFIAAIDSDFLKYRYDFKADRYVLKSIADSVKADTSRYEWTKDGLLAWKENVNDSTSEQFSVKKLTADSLLLLSKDSAAFLFTRVK